MSGHVVIEMLLPREGCAEGALPDRRLAVGRAAVRSLRALGRVGRPLRSGEDRPSARPGGGCRIPDGGLAAVRLPPRERSAGWDKGAALLIADTGGSTAETNRSRRETSGASLRQGWQHLNYPGSDRGLVQAPETVSRSEGDLRRPEARCRRSRVRRGARKGLGPARSGRANCAALQRTLAGACLRAGCAWDSHLCPAGDHAGPTSAAGSEAALARLEA
jgi:hypothetical protein